MRESKFTGTRQPGIGLRGYKPISLKAVEESVATHGNTSQVRLGSLNYDKAIERGMKKYSQNNHITNAKAPDVKAGDHPSVTAAKNAGGSGGGNPNHDPKTGEFTSK